MTLTAPLAALDAHFQSMPPVAALQLALAGYDGATLRLSAPLSAHVNDKGCAFGGSLASLMTLAGWGLVTLRLEAAGLRAEVFVADSRVRYRAPVFTDLQVTAMRDPEDPQDWSASIAALRAGARARLHLRAECRLDDGTLATEAQLRFVAVPVPGGARQG